MQCRVMAATMGYRNSMLTWGRALSIANRGSRKKYFVSGGDSHSCRRAMESLVASQQGKRFRCSTALQTAVAVGDGSNRGGIPVRFQKHGGTRIDLFSRVPSGCSWQGLEKYGLRRKIELWGPAVEVAGPQIRTGIWDGPKEPVVVSIFDKCDETVYVRCGRRKSWLRWVRRSRSTPSHRPLD